MIPVDGSAPSDFEGIDYTAYFRGSAVYDVQGLTDRVLDIIGDFLKKEGLSSRRCFRSGFGAAAGGPAFLETLIWVQEHWEFLAGAASVVLARVANVREKWRRLKWRTEAQILDPISLRSSLSWVCGPEAREKTPDRKPHGPFVLY